MFTTISRIPSHPSIDSWNLATEVGGDSASLNWSRAMLLPLSKEDGGQSMKVRFLTNSGSTSNPIEGLRGSDKVALLCNQLCFKCQPQALHGSSNIYNMFIYRLPLQLQKNMYNTYTYIYINLFIKYYLVVPNLGSFFIAPLPPTCSRPPPPLPLPLRATKL